jgi:hypothetical protein
MFKFVQSIQVCFAGDYWATGCDAIWVIVFFAVVAVVSVVVLALWRSVQEYLHRRIVNKWFAERAVTKDEE